ncbi:Golgi transport complex protein [Klebsormidium nitens]|uniref:Conserved oligomeric Golgi complex subunit 4 n=1 Tax=Klebsormidium nitens TaxID=105231 RepID=A0A1Y1HW59_KLENI|nr:Golgi transport complex protein [Klebsormidium nitens]|eukprot:GAQ80078.1 Golgi transport complex protein [Klebsormidium nitens]
MGLPVLTNGVSGHDGQQSMLDKIKGLTDVGAMTRLLHETIAQEREIDKELEVLLGQRQELERKLSSLHKSAEVLELVRADSDQMAASVRSTCSLAEHVSGKVRELDMAQSRVQDAITRINAIVDRTSCIEGVKTALEGEDYEAAAKYVETFLELDGAYHDAAVQENSAETAREQVEQLMQSKQQLEEVIRSKFAQAVESKDHEQVVRFAKLYPPLQLQEEGLRTFTAYLRGQVSASAKESIEALVLAMDRPAVKGAGPDFVGVLTELFKDIALTIEENEELLRTSFGEDAVPYVVRELQDECETRGAQILRQYSEYRKLARHAKDVTAKPSGGVGTAEGVDPREVEVYLEEMLLLTQRSEEYSQFMIAKIREAEAGGAQLSPGEVDAFKTGAFSRAVQELLGYYMTLEEYFMSENVSKAVRIDEFVEDALTTSMVDDVFYILQNCARRAISTGSVQCVCYCLNTANNLLGNEYKEALHRKTREPALAAKLFAGAAAAPKSGAEIATALNNVDVSAEYVQKLRNELDEFCAEMFSAPADREKIKTVLNDLGETAAALKAMAVSSLEGLANSISPRFRPLLDAVNAVGYELTEAQYAENEIHDPWVQSLLVAVEQNVTWLQPLLTTNNYDSLVHLIIEYIVKRIEVIMTQKRFNQLGGLQLDRDARTLVGHFSGMTQRTVRDKFARLTQMATILNLEKVSEILDYWGENSGPMTWRLTPAEVRRVLGLRVDFKPEAIAQLKL